MKTTGINPIEEAGPSARRGRRAALRRKSRETEVLVDLDLDPGSPSAEIDSGLGFLDHLLTSLATHAGWRLALVCRGDLEVDDHHSAEDCALALGEALARTLAKGGSPRRFGSAYAPLDEALARAVVDISGRPYCRAELGLSNARLGELEGENVGHFLVSLATAARITLHVDVLAGENAHHKAEAAFKALALALREACAQAGAAAVDSSSPESTKGSVILEEMPQSDWAAAAARLKGARNA
jgi:imidazoleglycerol-phosphate dehydratase